MAQLNNFPELRRQPLNCSLKQRFPLVSCATAFRAFSRIFGFPTIPSLMIIVSNIYRGLSVSALFPYTHKCRIDRNPGEPGRETGSLLEVLQVNEGFHQGFLANIFCILQILYDAVCPPQNLIGVSPAELEKGERVPTLCSRDQPRVGHPFQAAPYDRIIGWCDTSAH